MKDPKRLLEDPGSELDVLLLESGLDEAPPARVVDRTLVTLGVASAAVGLGAASAGAGAATMKATGWLGLFSGPWAFAAKLSVGVIALGGVVGGGYVVLGPDAPAANDAPAVVAPAPNAPNAPNANDGKPALAPAGDANQNGGPTKEAPAAAVDATREKAPAQPGQASQPGQVSQTGQAGAVPVSPKPVSEPSSPGKAQPAADAAATGAPTKGGSLAEEVRMLDAARTALKNGDKAGALAQLDAYAARFPKGQLKVEAQGMRSAINAASAPAAP